MLVDEYKAGFDFFTEVREAAQGAAAILVLTEWDRYAKLDWRRVSEVMATGAMIFDGRTIVDHAGAREAGLPVFTVGIGEAK